MYQYRLKMRNIVGMFAVFIVISYAIRAGKFYSTWSKADNGKVETTHQLTLEDIVRLSKKGTDLSWKDFEKYPSKEVGSGLYVRCYEMESPLQLFIGGGDLEEPPVYINLVNSRTGDSFDIRKNDVELMVYRKESKLDGRYDLNHDGIMEKICIEDSSVKENNQSSVQIAIYNDKGKRIWKKGLELSCTGQEGYYIFSRGCIDYLLHYTSDVSKGRGRYEYHLIYFDFEWQEQVQDEDILKFEYKKSSGVALPMDEMVSFADKINDYMVDSYLMLGIFDGKLKYLSGNHEITYKEKFQQFLNCQEQKKDIRSGLIDYQERINTGKK